MSSPLIQAAHQAARILFLAPPSSDPEELDKLLSSIVNELTVQPPMQEKTEKSELSEVPPTLNLEGKTGTNILIIVGTRNTPQEDFETGFLYGWFVNDNTLS